jgi:hypothetical protein
MSGSTPAPLPSRTVGRVLTVLAALELLTLAVLLGNLWTVHLRPITQTIGPVHGAVYLAVVVTVLIAPGFRPRERALGCLPVIGGPLARALAARRARTADRIAG